MSLPSKSLVRDDKKQHMSAKISKHAMIGLNDFRRSIFMKYGGIYRAQVIRDKN